MTPDQIDVIGQWAASQLYKGESWERINAKLRDFPAAIVNALPLVLKLKGTAKTGADLLGPPVDVIPEGLVERIIEAGEELLRAEKETAEIPEATGIEALISGMLGDAVKDAARRIEFGMGRTMEAPELERLLQRDIAERQAVCRKRYGQELAVNDAPLIARLQHAYEEALDLPMYAEWAAQALPDERKAAAMRGDAEVMAILELMDALRDAIIPDCLMAAAFLRGVIEVIAKEPLQLENGEVVR